MDYSWKLGDRTHWLEGMYGMLTGGMSDQTYIQCEHRNNIWGLVRANFVTHFKLCVIDDEIEEGALHLLRLVPKAWVRPDHLTRFEKIATEFGPVSVRFKLTDEGRNLDLTYEPRFRDAPRKVVLHVPPIGGLERVTVNGRSIAARPGATLNLN